MRIFIKSDGFTLIEALVALLVLAFALLALAGLMVTTTRNSSSGGHVTEAATFAQDKLEEFRAMSFDNILSGNDQKTGSHGIQYRRNWIIATNPGNNLKTVTLTIDWTDKNNHSIRVISAINR